MEERDEFSQEERPTEGLLSVRTLGIMLAGVVVGLVTGALIYAAGEPVPAAVVVGLGAAGSTMMGLHRVVERSQRRRHRMRHAACEHAPAAPRPPIDAATVDVAQRVGETTIELSQRVEETMNDEPELT